MKIRKAVTYLAVISQLMLSAHNAWSSLKENTHIPPKEAYNEIKKDISNNKLKEMIEKKYKAQILDAFNEYNIGDYCNSADILKKIEEGILNEIGKNNFPMLGESYYYYEKKLHAHCVEEISNTINRLVDDPIYNDEIEWFADILYKEMIKKSIETYKAAIKEALTLSYDAHLKGDFKNEIIYLMVIPEIVESAGEIKSIDSEAYKQFLKWVLDEVKTVQNKVTIEGRESPLE